MSNNDGHYFEISSFIGKENIRSEIFTGELNEPHIKSNTLSKNILEEHNDEERSDWYYWYKRNHFTDTFDFGVLHTGTYLYKVIPLWYIQKMYKQYYYLQYCGKLFYKIYIGECG